MYDKKEKNERKRERQELLCLNVKFNPEAMTECDFPTVIGNMGIVPLFKIERASKVVWFFFARN